jgi:DNA polymerase/3'-5' exonuclease PolX
MKLDEIQPIAYSLIEQLSSACTRLLIAGSIRRGKPEPNDIEIVAIPYIGFFTVRDMFGAIAEEHAVNHLDEALSTLYGLHEWSLDWETKRNGPNYKRLRHLNTGICCDLFITDARRWGIIATIRTGPGEFSKALVSYARRQTMFVQGGLLHRHAPTLDLSGVVLPCPSGDSCMRIVETLEEGDVFKALGLPWIEPQRRTPEALQAAIPRGTFAVRWS